MTISPQRSSGQRPPSRCRSRSVKPSRARIDRGMGMARAPRSDRTAADRLPHGHEHCLLGEGGRAHRPPPRSPRSAAGPDVRCWSAMAAPLNRQSVIDAARDCIVADGLEAISLRKLAASLGVTAPALYAYVDDKRDLLRAVAEREFGRLADAFERIDDPDPVERMRQMSLAYVDQAVAEPELFRTMFQFSPDLAIGGATGAEDPLATAVFELALGSVIEAIESGALRQAEPVTVALTMWSA